MSYLVLARKYRPQKFSGVIGQEHITKVLLNAVKHNRLAHSFLFTGTRGVGKTSIARILAKAVNCENPQNFEPCNECLNCTSITKGNNTDVIEIDGASNRGIDEIRNLQEKIVYPPISGNYKIIIIDEVHMLTNEAFNALLKTLEEPPPYIMFIFATTEIHKVPDTITSRCQRYDFRIVPRNTISDYLETLAQKENIKIEKKALDLAAEKGNGSIRDSLSILDQILAFSNPDETITAADTEDILGVIPKDISMKLIEKMLSNQSAKLIEEAQTVYKQYNINNLFKDLIANFQYFIWEKIGVKKSDLFVIDDLYYEKIKEINKITSLTRLMRTEKLLMELYDQLKRSEQPEILANLYLLYISKIEDLLDFREVIEEEADDEYYQNRIQEEKRKLLMGSDDDDSPKKTGEPQGLTSARAYDSRQGAGQSGYRDSENVSANNEGTKNLTTANAYDSRQGAGQSGYRDSENASVNNEGTKNLTSARAYDSMQGPGQSGETDSENASVNNEGTKNLTSARAYDAGQSAVNSEYENDSQNISINETQTLENSERIGIQSNSQNIKNADSEEINEFAENVDLSPENIEKEWKKLINDVHISVGKFIDCSNIISFKNDELLIELDPQMPLLIEKMRKDLNIIARLEDAYHNAYSKKIKLFVKNVNDKINDDSSPLLSSSKSSDKNVSFDVKVQNKVERVEISKEELEKERRMIELESYLKDHPDDELLEKLIKQFDLEILLNGG